jgi:hypothetical protein
MRLPLGLLFLCLAAAPAAQMPITPAIQFARMIKKENLPELGGRWPELKLRDAKVDLSPATGQTFSMKAKAGVPRTEDNHYVVDVTVAPASVGKVEFGFMIRLHFEDETGLKNLKDGQPIVFSGTVKFAQPSEIYIEGAGYEDVIGLVFEHCQLLHSR